METSLSRHLPELDGLRGIAIISVLIHHQLTPFRLTGGFLGVDLFFVLSGFLITGLLWAEFEKTSSISLRNFYMRRVLRLGPALTLYLIGCLLVAYHTQLIDVARQIKLIVIAIAYATNWRMAFGWDSFPDPTAIIWSLSIEEQFYLVWPVVLLGCLVLKIKRRLIVAGLGFVILAIAMHRYLMLTGSVDLKRLYYGTDTRADALLIGCFIALLPMRGLGTRIKRWLNLAGLFSVAGLAYLIVSSSFTDQFLYRGGFTAVALLAGVVISIAANKPPRILAATLQWGPLRWCGKISYGLYLWHWLVIRSTTFYYLGYWEPWARLALAVGIASASFYLVEKPFNRLKGRYAVRPRPRFDSQPVAQPILPDKTISPLGLPLAS
jgi:peptidoglycan/LPS O-acetylase OafA/YrhL